MKMIIVVIYILFALLILRVTYIIFKDCLDIKDQLEVEYIYNYCTENHECSICLENNTNVMLDCNHHFHEDCILEWFQYNATCPVCRCEV